MCFGYRVLWILQALWIVKSETINIVKKKKKKKKEITFTGSWMPLKIFTIGLCT